MPRVNRSPVIKKDNTPSYSFYFGDIYIYWYIAGLVANKGRNKGRKGN